jgi:hypothetical protein
MSKVKIQGNASGTGVVTLTAPNTNTDRTITLPDGTGTLVQADASGNVGIGTSSPERDLHVKGKSGDPVHFKLEGDPADYARIMFDDGTTDNIGEIRYHFGDDDMRFRTNSSERMRILSSGGITFNGDTAAANALDDYEEGTWTPVPVCTHNCGSWSVTGYTSDYGAYTKIGRMVYFYFKVTVTSISGTPSNMGISGLPFSAGFNHTNTGTAQNHDTGMLYNQESISGGGTQINVIRKFDNGNWYSSSSTPTTISGSGMYST